MTFKIITLGCKVNMYESTVIKEKMNKEGFVEEDKNVDIVIINTCSVTNMADSKSRKLIRREKKDNKNAIIVVCGCSAQNHQSKLEEIGIDILIGNKEKSIIPTLIKEYIKTSKKYIKFYNEKNLPFEDMTVDKFTSHTRGFIKIQDGCNNYCSYCIIPYLRGNIRSKDFDVSLKEAETLAENNHQEIVLTGIHTGSYGQDKNYEYDLVDLINAISNIDNLKRIRISSIEVTELNEKFMNLLKDNKKVCNHLHIPLQSGSNKILKAMNRKYDLEYYEEQINKIRSIRPDISITTDVIVGFPGETEENFKETLSFCEKINFAKIHVFPYSKRDLTIAAKMEHQVEGNIKKQRSKELIILSNKLEYNYNKVYEGKIVEVLVEENIGNTSIGHTSNYLKVIVNSIISPNSMIRVKIISSNTEECIGKLV